MPNFIIKKITITFKIKITIDEFNKEFDANVNTWTRAGGDYKHKTQWNNYIHFVGTTYSCNMLHFEQIIKTKSEVNFVIGRFIEIVCSHFEVEKIEFK